MTRAVEAAIGQIIGRLGEQLRSRQVPASRENSLWILLAALAIAVINLIGGIATAAVPPFPATDIFDNGGHPNPAVWQTSTAGGLGWSFLSSTVAGGAFNPSGSGTILAGGP